MHAIIEAALVGTRHHGLFVRDVEVITLGLCGDALGILLHAFVALHTECDAVGGFLVVDGFVRPPKDGERFFPLTSVEKINGCEPA
ncbi:MAG: hypothetical protein IIW85_07170, partial [Bacteroidaceae bacterium]|nr:hypothetical protein [Bacteroidaceae bacterium]